MAIRIATQSGLWKNNATWGGNPYPVNNDTFDIPVGIEVEFDDNQSAFPNGIGASVINGLLKFKTDIITFLKLNGNITGNGTFKIGDELHPIQRPTAGVGSDARAYLNLNATATINVPTVEMDGWYPSDEYTTTSADAALNATQIILSEDMGFQQGDQLFIESSLEYSMAEANNGVYTVSNYNSGTKTITLTSPLLYARPSGSRVAFVSRTIKINRTSGTNPLLGGEQDNAKFRGVNTTLTLNTQIGIPSKRINRTIVKHCTGMSKVLLSYHYDALIEDSLALNAYPCAGMRTTRIKRCISTKNLLLYSNEPDTIIEDSIGLNAWSLGSGGYFKNCSVITPDIGTGYLHDIGKSVFKDCIIQLTDGSTGVGTYNGAQKYINCIFKANTLGYFSMCSGELFNCLFEGENDINHTTLNIRPVMSPLKSFNHNQIENNNREWHNGGRIETELVNEAYIPSKLKFICESATAPVFKDYLIMVPANREVKFPIGLIKDTADIICKLQVIEPNSDPLIDSSFVPLAESAAENSIVDQDLGIHYESTVPRQLILRVFCQGLGNVTVDTSSIDNVMAHPVNY
ncbi:MAG: hypothetical protein CVV28_02240 [Methanobacteriales archaeon HGW-Methanobacteriales-1]|jgi:hypothetical protein|nr:MAG: hypothetical protein CVV28_02240 [Methanobacteriales archaeon HGW-Methanobacteriales-1]